MDLQRLLAEAVESPPGGPNLEYDAAFLALEAEVQGKPEQEAGGTLIPAVEPDWPKVLEQSQALLVRSKDLRIAMHLVRALTRVENLGGFVAGIELVNELLERYWETVYPQLDAEDNNDPTLRLNALAPLEPPKGPGAAETLLRDLRETAVVPPTPQGRVTLRDLLAADGKLTTSAPRMDPALIEALFRSAVEKDPGVAALPARAVAAVQRLRALVAERVGGELAPDPGAIVEMLKPATQRMARFGGTPEVAGAGTVSGDGGRIGGAIRGRDDVNRALDAICAYLERAEPANPAPLLLRRAQRLLEKNFVELIADLAPESVGQVKLIAGLKDE
jgi:type VI secretion system protein ImpA